jgi:hypothetical protein
VSSGFGEALHWGFMAPAGLRRARNSLVSRCRRLSLPHPRAAGAGLPGRGVCTRAVHPTRARRGAPATPPPGIGTWPPPIRPTSERVWWGARQGRVVTRAVRAPVRPATLMPIAMHLTPSQNESNSGAASGRLFTQDLSPLQVRRAQGLGESAVGRRRSFVCHSSAWPGAAAAESGSWPPAAPAPWPGWARAVLRAWRTQARAQGWGLKVFAKRARECGHSPSAPVARSGIKRCRLCATSPLACPSSANIPPRYLALYAI